MEIVIVNSKNDLSAKKSKRTQVRNHILAEVEKLETL